MKKLGMFFSFIILGISLVACGSNDQANELSDEVLFVEVDFIVPETVEVDETITLTAEVMYGDDIETDAVVRFEVWEKGDEDNSEMFDAENNGDGTYTHDYTFTKDGIYEMYAHTDAQHQHVMPKKEITVGEGGDYSDIDIEESFHTDGFDMHFEGPDTAKQNEEIELLVQLTLNEEPLAGAKVRYEIWLDNNEEETDWIDAAEEEVGEYLASHEFSEIGTYFIQVHVEDEKELHEHAIYEVTVH